MWINIFFEKARKRQNSGQWLPFKERQEDEMGKKHTDWASGICNLLVFKLGGGFSLLLYYITYIYILHKLFCMQILLVLRMKRKYHLTK